MINLLLKYITDNQISKFKIWPRPYQKHSYQSSMSNFLLRGNNSDKLQGKVAHKAGGHYYAATEDRQYVLPMVVKSYQYRLLI